MRKRELYTGNKPFSFVAFSHSDTEIAEELINNLDVGGYRYWFNAKIEPSEKDIIEISKRLSASVSTILVLTENSMVDRIFDSVVVNTLERKCPIVVYLPTETKMCGLYLEKLYEKYSQVVVLRAWEQDFQSSNSLKQVLSYTKGLTREQAEFYYNKGVSTIQSGTTDREQLMEAWADINRAVNGEYPPALNFMGDVALERARAGMESYSTVMLYYKMAKEKGDTNAVYRIGCLLADGECFENLPGLASRYIAIAAVRGIPDAQYRFAEMLESGKGITMNRSEATSWYKKALENGDRRPYLTLAKRYLKGDTVVMDESVAVKYLEEAIKDEIPEAYLLLAKCYKDGVGVTRNNTKAENYFCKAAKMGIPEAQYNYAMYLNKEKKYVEAFKWFSVAVTELPEGEKPDSDVLYEIAECYAKGNGTDIDRKKAFLYYYEAALMGNNKAKTAVSECYRKGIGVAINKKAAAFFNPKCAENV